MRAGRLAAVVLGLLALMLCAGGALAADHLVRITSTLSPATITIAPGDSITWRNDDAVRHRMRSTSGPVEFDSGDLDPGTSFTITLTAVGTYAYRDERDRERASYWGSIVVAEPAASGAGVPSSAPQATPGGGTTINMAGRVFSPGTITITTGTTVTWRNNDDRDHTATSSSGAFDSGLLAPGRTYARTFATAGSYPFLCLLHPDMRGVVNVLGAGGATPPPATPAPPTAPPAKGDVVILDFRFTPGELTVDAGTRITFANRGAALHTVTATDGAFDSGLIAPNGSFGRVFTEPGTFPFLCTLHPAMTGTIRVRGPNGATPPPAPTPAPGPTAAPGSMRIVDFAFEPRELRVLEGSIVAWVNAGVAPHTVTARDGSFDSGWLASGESWQRVFSSAGAYEFLCALHPTMTGTILVTAAAPGGSPAVPRPSAVAVGIAAPDSSIGADPPVDAGSGPVVTVADGRAGQSGPGFVLVVFLALLLCLVALGAYGLVIGDVIRRAER